MKEIRNAGQQWANGYRKQALPFKTLYALAANMKGLHSNTSPQIIANGESAFATLTFAYGGSRCP